MEEKENARRGDGEQEWITFGAAGYCLWWCKQTLCSRAWRQARDRMTKTRPVESRWCRVLLMGGVRTIVYVLLYADCSRIANCWCACVRRSGERFRGFWV
jgi:hypothetical protein